MLEQYELCYLSQIAGDCQKDQIQQSCRRAMSGNRLLDLTTEQILRTYKKGVIAGFQQLYRK